MKTGETKDRKGQEKKNESIREAKKRDKIKNRK